MRRLNASVRTCQAAKLTVQRAGGLGRPIRLSGASVQHVQEDVAAAMVHMELLLADSAWAASESRDEGSNASDDNSSASASSICIPKEEHSGHAGRWVNIAPVRSRQVRGTCTCCTSSASGEVRIFRSETAPSGLLPSGDVGALAVQRHCGPAFA